MIFFYLFVYVSAFVARLVLGEDSLLESVYTSPKSKEDDNRAALLIDDMGPKVSAIEVDDRGNNDFACVGRIYAINLLLHYS